MGLSYGINNTSGKIPESESKIILSEAFKEGIRILDTAEAYGNAHRVIGDFHKSNPDKIFGVITKILPSDDLSRIEGNITRYLNELNVDRLEGLMFHTFHSYKNHLNDLPEITRLKNDGLFKQLGVSVYTNSEFSELINDNAIDLIQLPFNLLDNFPIRGKLLNEAKRNGKTIHTRSAFLQGLFLRSPFDNHPIVHALKRQLVRIQEIADEQGVSKISLALSYCLAQSSIDQVLIGVDSLRQLKSNLKASTYQIDIQVIRIINKLHTENKNLLNPSLWDSSNF